MMVDVMNNIQLHTLHSTYVKQPVAKPIEKNIGKLTFFHGVCHSNNRMYGIPFCSDYILEVMPSSPLELSLYHLPSFN